MIDEETKNLDAIRIMDDGPEREAAIEALTPRQRLHLLWLMLLHALLDRVGNPDEKASLLSVARQFLQDNGSACHRDSYSLRSGLESLADDEFPSFEN